MSALPWALLALFVACVIAVGLWHKRQLAPR